MTPSRTPLSNARMGCPSPNVITGQKVPVSDF
jgi:hypothetical protein